MQIRKGITVDFEKMSYFPAIFFNDFWLLKDYLIPMNSTVKELPLHLTVSGLSGFKYMLYNQAEQSFNMQVSLAQTLSSRVHRMGPVNLPSYWLVIALTA